MTERSLYNDPRAVPESKVAAECLGIWAVATVSGLAVGGVEMATTGMWLAVPLCVLWINYRVFGHALPTTTE